MASLPVRRTSLSLSRTFRETAFKAFVRRFYSSVKRPHCRLSMRNAFLPSSSAKNLVQSLFMVVAATTNSKANGQIRYRARNRSALPTSILNWYSPKGLKLAAQKNSIVPTDALPGRGKPHLCFPLSSLLSSLS